MAHTNVNNEPIDILKSRNSITFQSGNQNLSVRNLEESVSSEELYHLFVTCGDVLSCSVISDYKGKSKGYGFVNFSNKQDAHRAMLCFNGTLINGRKICVSKIMGKSELAIESKNYTNFTLYVKDFPNSYVERDLFRLFSDYGNVISCCVIEKESSSNIRFCFIKFDNEEDAEAAIEYLNGLLIDGRALYVEHAKNRQYCYDYRNNISTVCCHHNETVDLFVNNIDGTVSDKTLLEVFSEFGNVLKASVMFKDGIRQNYGFVRFSSPEEASKAVTVTNGFILKGRKIHVSLARRKKPTEITSNSDPAQQGRRSFSQNQNVLSRSTMWKNRNSNTRFSMSNRRPTLETQNSQLKTDARSLHSQSNRVTDIKRDILNTIGFKENLLPNLEQPVGISQGFNILNSKQRHALSQNTVLKMSIPIQHTASQIHILPQLPFPEVDTQYQCFCSYCYPIHTVVHSPILT